jgi:hypothetical protein
MRVVILVALLFDVAHAEVRPVRNVSVTAALQTHESYLSGLTEDGWGPQLEVALGSGAWQAFVEGSVSRVELAAAMPFDHGARWRGGIGARWIARSFTMDRVAAAELVFEAVTGVQRFEWDAGGTMHRGDAGLGIGWQARFFIRKHQLGFRFVARVMYAPTSRDRATALCTGACEMPTEAANTGFTGVVGLSW